MTVLRMHQLSVTLMALTCFGRFEVRSQIPIDPTGLPENKQSPIYPPTPILSTIPTTIPGFQPLVSTVALTTLPGASGNGFEGGGGDGATALTEQSSTTLWRPFTPSRNTVPRWISTTLLPTAPADLSSTTPLTKVVTSSTAILQRSTFPFDVVAPPSIPQHVQLSFSNKYNDLMGNDYDVWSYRSNLQKQLAEICGFSTNQLDRITDLSIQHNSTGFLVVRFTIQQGYPVYATEALYNFRDQINSTDRLQLSGQRLLSPVTIFWTDNGTCPIESCMNGGICDVTLSGDYYCDCAPGYVGDKCQKQNRPNNAYFALLVLLIIPIAVALFIGFYFGLRRQKKLQLKRKFDLRDVRTIGPRSMLSLPQEPGIRNQMYDTRSFAMAFTDTTFSKSSTPVTEKDLINGYE